MNIIEDFKFEIKKEDKLEGNLIIYFNKLINYKF